MADYFFLVNPGSGIHSEVNVTRFVSNKLKTTMEAIDFKVFVYTQAKASVVWKKIDEKMFDLNLAKCEENLKNIKTQDFYSLWLKNLRDSSNIEIFSNKL